MKRTRMMILFVSALSLVLPSIAAAYPNGTPMYVTDAAPFCASCHSAAKAQYMPELPAEAARKETPEFKHYALVKMPAMPSPYAELTVAQKERLIKNAQQIDSRSSVTVSAPPKAKSGQTITVTVKAAGGNGPAIGIMLVDGALRFQSSPISASGWMIVGEPEVRGQGGKIQTEWLDRRLKGLSRAINYVNIEGQAFDPSKEIYPEATVVYTLRAPSQPGVYVIAAAFLYGTENAESAGFFQRPSGRILFSEEVGVKVE